MPVVSTRRGLCVILSCKIARVTSLDKDSRELPAQRPARSSSIFFCPKAVLPADKNEERSSTDLK